MNKINVIVVFGGCSVEHDISIITGVQVVNNLDKERFNVIPVYLSKKGEFYYSQKFFDITFFSKKDFLKDKKCYLVNFNGKDLVRKSKFKDKLIFKVDFCFLATHGDVGENGGIQGFFDVLNIPYSSCGILQSAVGMNKWMTKIFLKDIKTPFVEGKLLKEYEKIDLKNINVCNEDFPVVVKPCSLGSSVGISFCKNKTQLKRGVSFAFMFDRDVVIEGAIKNLKEVNIAVLGNCLEQEFSDIEEVVKSDEILSFENKYMGDKSSKGIENTKRILPADLKKEIKEQIEEIATNVFKSLGCKGIIRFDFLVDLNEDKVYLNEFNTIPGSFANYLWKTKKYNFKDILNRIYDYCMKDEELKSKKIKNFSSGVLEQFGNCEGFKMRK